MIESLREYVNYIERDWGVEKREKTINIFREREREREEKRRAKEDQRCKQM